MDFMQRYMGIYVVFVLYTNTNAYPTGPPVDSVTGLCTSMDPTGHQSTAQTNTNPFTISISQKCYKKGDKLKVTIKGGQFKGYFVQARKGSDTSMSYGTFSTDDTNQKTLQCFSMKDNAIGHSAAVSKTSTSFYWTPKDNDTFNLTFMATIVRKKKTYWMGVTSDVLKYDMNCTDSNTNGSSSVQYQAILAGICLILAVYWWMSAY